jgi:hypothetical protein
VYETISYIIYSQFMYYLAITEWLIIAIATANVVLYVIGLLIAIVRSVRCQDTRE